MGAIKNQVISASFRDYEKFSGVTVEVREYERPKALLDGARNGEFDLLHSYYTDLAMMLGAEGMLLDMEGVLKEYLENDTDYYTNILEAGRMNGELLMVIPCFSLAGIRVPKVTYESYGKPFETRKHAAEYYLGWMGSDGEVSRTMAIEKGEPILAAADTNRCEFVFGTCLGHRNGNNRQTSWNQQHSENHRNLQHR